MQTFHTLTTTYHRKTVIDTDPFSQAKRHMIPNSTQEIHINRERLLQRFLRYIQIGTNADPNSDTYPSTPEQADLNRLLAEELAAMSIDDAHMDENALTWGTVPATNGGGTPVVALVAHVDTSPEAPGHGVKPQVITYEGGDIELPSGTVISPSSSNWAC